MTHVLLIASCLYINNKEPTDGQGDHMRYSKIKGLHVLPWAAGVQDHFRTTFNADADFARQDMRSSKAEGDEDDTPQPGRT